MGDVLIRGVNVYKLQGFDQMTDIGNDIGETRYGPMDESDLPIEPRGGSGAKETRNREQGDQIDYGEDLNYETEKFRGKLNS